MSNENTIIAITILFSAIFVIFIIGLVIFVRQYIVRSKAHKQEIQSIGETHKKELLETQIEIQSQTMKHIGREIHDNIGQKLTLASLYSKRLLMEDNTQHVSSAVGEIGEIIDVSLTELRGLSKSLTNDSVWQHTLGELIEEECRRINDLKECEVHFENNFERVLESYQTKSILFRITQEFLQNSIKHARCKHIWVSLSESADQLTMVLKDNGIGFDTEKPTSKGIGLRNMRKRAQMIGGSARLVSEKSRATTLTVQIPL